MTGLSEHRPNTDSYASCSTPTACLPVGNTGALYDRGPMACRSRPWESRLLLVCVCVCTHRGLPSPFFLLFSKLRPSFSVVLVVAVYRDPSGQELSFLARYTLDVQYIHIILSMTNFIAFQRKSFQYRKFSRLLNNFSFNRKAVKGTYDKRLWTGQIELESTVVDCVVASANSSSSYHFYRR